MELSWSTFLLEILNFLVLVWILKRFLYQPILDVIAQRRTGIEKSLSDAKGLHEEAEALRQRYDGRLAEWEQAQQRARAALAKEIEDERTRRLAELETAVAKEREKLKAAEAHRQAETLREMEAQALAQGVRFATRILSRTAGPELEAHLVELAVTELAQLKEEQQAALRNSWGETAKEVIVSSAHLLSEGQRRNLEQALAAATGLNAPLRFEQEPNLMAGVRITIGAWVLDANLQAELRGFADLAHGG